MLKKTIVFDNLEGEPVTKDFYFHFNKLELLELELSLEDGIEQTIKRLTETDNANEAYQLFKRVILEAYGKKDANGVDFYKKDPQTGRPYKYELEASPALSEIILEFLEDPKAGAEFVQAALPAKLVKEALELQKLEKRNNPTDEQVGTMVQEAAERQADPATAVAPGPAPVADVPQELMVVNEDTDERTIEQYSKDELLAMPKEQFDKLAGTDPRQMSRDTLMIAMQRKNS